MYEENYSKRGRKFKTRIYSINPWGVFIFILKVFVYGFLLCLPFLILEFFIDYDPTGPVSILARHKPYVLIILYALMATEFIRHPSHFILRGEPWNERIFIRSTTYEEDDDYDDYSNWPTK